MTKIGIITDIHSNIIALNAVLEEFKRRKVDKIICCGDIIGIGPNPEETVQTLIKQNDLIIVKGNHENYLIDGLPEKVHDEKTIMPIEQIKHHKWIHSQISELSKEFINKLPVNKTVEIEGKKIYIVHYPINENGEYKKHIKNATIEQNEEMFDKNNADIFLYGHTHTTNINEKNNKWYINPGSLGCPMLSKGANVGILTIDEERVELEHLIVEYDVKKVISQIKEIKYPDYEEILEIFYCV